MSEKSAKIVGSNPPARAGAADAGMAEAVVEAALLRVGEDGVGLGRFLEVLFGLLCRRDCGRDGTSAPACGTRS